MHRTAEHRGKQFIGLTDIAADFHEVESGMPGQRVLLSRDVRLDIPANELVICWNPSATTGTGMQVEVRATSGDHTTGWYVMGRWSPDAVSFPRESVNSQSDADGHVSTDTLDLTHAAQSVQLRVTLYASSGGTFPTLKFAGICAADTTQTVEPLESDKSVWGSEIVVPSRAQYGWPDQSGWCSPTSVTMVLAYWSGRLSRSELDMPVPTVAHAIYDKVYDGTGNWPFNTAFAGSFDGIRAYVTRLSDIRELEEWVAVGIPPVVSVSYDLLNGKPKDEDPGHLMVCDGFTATGDIVLNDPAHHPDRGQNARRIFPRANFERAWKRSKDLVYLIYPENAPVPHDRYGHWLTAPGHAPDQAP